MRALYILVLATGCGRFGFGVIEGQADGGVDGAPRFDRVGVVAELSDTRFADPDVSDDGLELLVSASNQAGDLALFLASRGGLDQRWSTPAEIGFAGFGGVSDGELSSDGATLWFAGIVDGEADLYEVSRADSTVARIDELSTPGVAEFGLTVTADGLRALFTREPGEQQELAEIYESRRASVDDPWGPPQPVAGVNSDGFDGNPNISPDGLRLLFDSTRDDPGRLIYFTSRPSVDAPFTAPELVDLGGQAADPSLTESGALLLFISDRTGEQRLHQAFAE